MRFWVSILALTLAGLGAGATTALGGPNPSNLGTSTVGNRATAPIVASAGPSVAQATSRRGKTAAERAVRLVGTSNTRDLGGLRLRSGYVRSGLVYRSGALCYITPDDVKQVNALGLKTIVDLRANSEVAKEGLDRAGVRANLHDYLRLPMICRHGVKREAYFSYMEGNAAVYKTFFATLSKPYCLPLLFHCSAGKDRTGILAALLLEVLGAERATISDDYLTSKRNSPGLVVEPEWLGAVYETVDAAGGVRAFLAKKGVSERVLVDVRHNLVEGASQQYRR